MVKEIDKPISLIMSLNNRTLISLAGDLFNNGLLGDPTHDKVMWKRSDEQGGSELKGPPGSAQHLPKNQNLSTVYYIMPFTNSSDINRGLSQTTFLWKKST